mmetsp:Transcript_13780/g.35385  ORF Transcript_13780/g.35385 Transcript_13780/m.35385 type:complete len:258 (+) Transcript_13780:1464-2237(+)
MRQQAGSQAHGRQPHVIIQAGHLPHDGVTHCGGVLLAQASIVQVLRQHLIPHPVPHEGLVHAIGEAKGVHALDERVKVCARRGWAARRAARRGKAQAGRVARAAEDVHHAGVVQAAHQHLGLLLQHPRQRDLSPGSVHVGAAQVVADRAQGALRIAAQNARLRPHHAREGDPAQASLCSEEAQASRRTASHVALTAAQRASDSRLHQQPERGRRGKDVAQLRGRLNGTKGKGGGPARTANPVLHRNIRQHVRCLRRQ